MCDIMAVDPPEDKIEMGGVGGMRFQDRNVYSVHSP